MLAGEPASVPLPLAWLFSMGGSGVDAFFTLSAFLLTLPFVAARQTSHPEPDLRVYAKRRLLRILPAYYLQIGLLIAFGALGVSGGWAWVSPTPLAVLAHAVFLIDAWPLIPAQLPTWWTLPVEMAFYLLLPWFARCLRPGRWPWLLLGIAASLVYRYFVMHSGLTFGQKIVWGDHLPGRLYQFLIGMLAAYFFIRMKAANELRKGRAADWLGLVAAAMFIALPAMGYPVSGSAYQGEPNSSAWLLSWHGYSSLVVAALLVALTAGAPALNRVFSWPPLRGLGLISYSLYLWHYPMMLAVREGLGGIDAARGDFWTFFGYSVMVSVLVAIASWWLVEQPAQRWGRRPQSAKSGL